MLNAYIITLVHVHNYVNCDEISILCHLLNSKCDQLLSLSEVMDKSLQTIMDTESFAVVTGSLSSHNP